MAEHASSDEKDLTGTCLGEYDIESLIDVGAGGSVYKARHRTTGAIVAVKVSTECENQRDQQRFAQEIAIQRALSHKNLIPLLNSGEESKLVYFAMPLYKGNLISLFPGIHTDMEKIRFIFSGILDAVEHAHQSNVLHRDLKPANVLLADDDSPIVADFSLGRFTMNGAKRLTTTSESGGTPAYMAPEAHAGLEKVTAKSDIFSLGRILLELTTGTLDPDATAGLPEELSRIIDKCTQSGPSRRYVNVTELKSEFSQVMSQILVPSPASEMEEYMQLRKLEQAGKRWLRERLLIHINAQQKRVDEMPHWEDLSDEEIALQFKTDDSYFSIEFALADVLAAATDPVVQERLNNLLEQKVLGVPAAAFEQSLSSNREADIISASNFIARQRNELLQNAGIVKLEAGPKQILHLVPLGTEWPSGILTPVNSFAPGALFEERGLLQPVARIEDRFDADLTDYGLLTVKRFASAVMPTGYAQLFKTGQIESVRVLHATENLRIFSQRLEDDLVEACYMYMTALKRLGVAPPVVIALMFSDISGYQLVRSSGEADFKESFASQSFDLPTVTVENWNQVLGKGDAARLLYPNLVKIWEASGQQYRGWYSPDGSREIASPHIFADAKGGHPTLNNLFVNGRILDSARVLRVDEVSISFQSLTHIPIDLGGLAIIKASLFGEGRFFDRQWRAILRKRLKLEKGYSYEFQILETMKP